METLAVNQRKDDGKESPMRVGLLAPDFPPELGGMEQMALGLATALSISDEVIVYTRVDRGVDDAPFRQERMLTGDLAKDGEGLVNASVDCWLSLTSGMFPLAMTLRRPFVGYLIGNDFLDPWIGYPGRWDELAQTPLVWRLFRRLRRLERQGRIREGIDAARGVLVLSGAVARLATRVFPAAAAKMTIVPPGVDDDFFGLSRGPAHGHLRLLTVSRLTSAARRKNIDGVLRALALLGDRLAATYTVIGDGDDRVRLEDLARSLKVQDRVSFLGGVSRDALLGAYGQADLFVMAAKASRRDVEGFGIVYLEASAAGVPVLVSQEGGALDAVSHMENGLLIGHSTPESIAEGLLQFARCRDVLSPIKVRGFAERYRWRTIGATVRGHLGRLIAGNVGDARGRSC